MNPKKYKWIDRGSNMGQVMFCEDNYFLSYQPNHIASAFAGLTNLDSAQPETAIVILKDKKDGADRYLIFRGDRRKELETIAKDLDRLKAYWKEHGGHFWSDDLDDTDDDE